MQLCRLKNAWTSLANSFLSLQWNSAEFFKLWVANLGGGDSWINLENDFNKNIALLSGNLVDLKRRILHFKYLGSVNYALNKVRVSSQKSLGTSGIEHQILKHCDKTKNPRKKFDTNSTTEWNNSRTFV